MVITDREAFQEVARRCDDVTLGREANCLKMRPIPGGYRAMMAICSDLDETPDAEVYFELMRFLNTDRKTSMGEGVNLEVGNTIYFDMPPGHFSYWNTDDRSREQIRELIRSGHIDCLHSYGDEATTRAHAARALEEMDRHGCRLKVWIDHASAVTNFGADIMRGQGDVRTSPAYHADLTLGYGVEYVWRGRVTSIIGQDRQLSVRGIGDWKHPAASFRTIGVQMAKQGLARLGNRKYSLHRKNVLARNEKLRDGGQVIEFMRCNPYFDGLGNDSDTGFGIAKVINRRFLNALSSRGGFCLLYTHLGKLSKGSPRRFDESAVAAFRLLAEYYREGRILVTTTRRLLDYFSGKSETTSGKWERLLFPTNS